MLKMRLQRIGRKNQPSFRVVVTDSRNAQVRGRHVDIVGAYEPRQGTFEIDAEKAKKWISQGVQPSDTVYNFLITKKIIEGKKKNVLGKKSPIIDEAKIKAEAEAKAAAEEKARKEAEEAKAAAEAPVEAAPEAPTPEVATEAAEEAPVEVKV
jgi:small subunit ribosomal protein S16